MDNLRNPPRQMRSRSLVDRIVDATARILIDGRHDTLTTNGAAAEAGISVGSLYRYFRNRDELIVAVIEREGRRCYDQIREAIQWNGSGTLAEHVAQIVRATVSAYRSTPLEGMPGRADLRRIDVFDCRAAALSAISDAFRVSATARSCGGLANDDEAPVIMAEIIVALVEAATLRPSSALSLENVEATAVEVATAYLEHVKT